MRLEVRLEEGGEAAAAAFYSDICPDPRTGRRRFLRTLPSVLEFGRLALYPERPADFAREEGLAIALDAGGADPVREMVAAYERLGLL